LAGKWAGACRNGRADGQQGWTLEEPITLGAAYRIFISVEPPESFGETEVSLKNTSASPICYSGREYFVKETV